MRYRVTEIKTPPSRRPDMEKIVKATEKKVAKALHCSAEKVTIKDPEIIRQSIDARKKPDVKMVYTVDFDFDGQLPFDRAVKKTYEPVRLGSDQVTDRSALAAGRPVIAGFGPCGIFAALILAEAGLRPIVLERGKPVEERNIEVMRFQSGETSEPDPESNVQFGEGGAGTFSDGKLTTGIRDVRIRKVLEEFVKAGADEEILYKQKPHIGTDRLQVIVRNLRARIEELGGEVRFNKKLEGIQIDSGSTPAAGNAPDRDAQAADGDRSHLKAITVRDNASGEAELLHCETLILATGHSARDTFAMLHEMGVTMEQKPFSIGVRIEHPQEMINRAQYGDPKLAEIIGAAEYKLSHKCENGRGVYTFCMCPGGSVINASTEKETHVTNGMSNSARDGEFANSGLLVDVRTSDLGDGPLAGVEFQRKYERLAWQNKAVSTYGSFRDDSGDPVRNSIPAFASEAIMEAMPHFGRKLEGFDRDDAKMTAVESRSSSPVRIKRDKNMQSSISGLMPAGEGPGYAGGIMSAAVDGIRAAEKVIYQFIEKGE